MHLRRFLKARGKLISLAFFFSQLIPAQNNLIPNPSFEDSISVPDNGGQIGRCKNWYSAFMTPDYFSVYSPQTVTATSGCGPWIPRNFSGFQLTKTGRFYVGILHTAYPASQGWPNYSVAFELLGNRLSQPLIKDHIYDFSLNYSLSNASKIINNQLSAYFSVAQFSLDAFTFDPLSQPWYDNNINNIIPQINNDTTQFLSSDTLNWQLLQGCFKANGGEEYVTIGNFRDKKFNKYKTVTSLFNPSCTIASFDNTFYLYIDDVSLFDRGYYSGAAQCRNDTTICFNSGIILGNNIKDSSAYVWQPAAGLSCTNCPNPIASPTATTKYRLTKSLCGLVTKDSITVAVYTPSVPARAGNNATLCLNNQALLGSKDSTSFTKYSWLPASYLSCSACATPLSKPPVTITYTLQKTECTVASASTVQITVEDCETMYTIPNIFSPNDDGVNETWGVKFNHTKNVKNFSMHVYNRWGTLLYEADKSAAKWDGMTTAGLSCSAGVYYYIITFELAGERKIFKGNLALIR